MEHGFLSHDWNEQHPNPNQLRWKPFDFPKKGEKISWIDGLKTVSGAGDPRLRNGVAIHIYTCNVNMSGMISHKKPIITIFGHKHKIKNFIKNFYIFHKKFQQPSILVYIWNKIANFESQLH